MTKTFKVGDRVTYTDRDDDVPYGSKGTIVQIDGILAKVEFDDWYCGHGEKGNRWWVNPQSLVQQPVEQTKPVYGNIKVGDTVRVKEDFPPLKKGMIGTVVGDGTHSVLVEYSGWTGGHDGQGLGSVGSQFKKDRWFTTVHALEVVERPGTATHHKPHKPHKPLKVGTQACTVYQHLSKGMTLTRIKADHLYRIASLTKVISELVERGHDIRAVWKTDPTGRPYKEYSLRQTSRKAA